MNLAFPQSSSCGRKCARMWLRYFFDHQEIQQQAISQRRQQPKLTQYFSTSKREVTSFVHRTVTVGVLLVPLCKVTMHQWRQKQPTFQRCKRYHSVKTANKSHFWSCNLELCIRNCATATLACGGYRQRIFILHSKVVCLTANETTGIGDLGDRIHLHKKSWKRH